MTHDIKGYRVGAGFFALTNLVGWAWFIEDFDLVSKICMPFILVALFVAAVTGIDRYQPENRNTFLGLYLTGILILLVYIYKNMTANYGVDYTAASINAMQIFILAKLSNVAISH